MNAWPLRVVVVEDEAPARARLRGVLKRAPNMRWVGEAGDAEAARRLVEERGPEIVLLDINLGGEDGFSFLASLDQGIAPEVVFVTAFDAYAVDAFRVHAVDFVVKPFDDDRVLAALARAGRRANNRREGELPGHWRTMVAALALPITPYRERISVRQRGRVRIVDVGQISWIDAGRAACILHLRDGTQMRLNEPIGDVEAGLDPTRFLRIHRSTIVRVEDIRTLSLRNYGDYEAVMRDGHRVNVSRAARARLEAML